MKENFAASLVLVLKHEGGYTNDKADPGGPTNYGITIYDARMYWKPDATATDVRHMPLSVAKSIYKSKYWDKMGCDLLPSGVDYCTFDYGVNSGVNRALRVLGAFRGTPAQTIAFMCDERMSFLKKLKIWPIYAKGWTRRVADVRIVSLNMAGSPPIVMAEAPGKPAGALIAPPPLRRIPPKDAFEEAARAAEQEDKSNG